MKKSIRLEPPDGGWGIVVCIGMTMPFIFIFGSMPSFGLIFGDFLESVGAETSAIAFITSAFFFAFSFAGLFANSLFKIFSVRTIGIVGGIIYFIGSMMQIYVTTTIQLTVAFSLVQGIAAGFIIPSALTTFNSYFVKRRVMMMALTQTLIGIACMFYPVVVQKLNEWYGFRGSLLVIAAINSHVILGMLVMHPVDWHMKRIEVSLDEIEKDRSVPLLDAEKRRRHRDSQISIDTRTNENLSNRMGSCVSVIDKCNDPQVLSAASSEEIHTLPEKTSFWQIIVEFLDLSLLKDPIYVNIVLGMSFAVYSDIAFFTLQPMYLFELSYTKVETASIIAIGAAADLISRVVIVLSAFFVTVSSRYLFLAGAFFTVITRFAFLEVFDFFNMAIVTGIMGFLHTWIYIAMPLVLGEYLPKERFSSGYGLFMFLEGNIIFFVGPIVGYIRDRTKNYAVSFHCLNFYMALCVLPWLIEMVYLKCRKRKKGADYHYELKQIK